MSDQHSIRVSVKAIIVRDEKVLLIGYELDDGYGFHFNLPGGGVAPGEELHEALRREVLEEANAEIDIGPLLFVTEYVPAHHANIYGSTQSLSLIFYCQLRPGSEPEQPLSLVDEQKGVYWIALSDLPHAPLVPNMGRQIQSALARNLPVADPFVTDWR